MGRRYYERQMTGLGRIVLETRGLRGRLHRFAYCADDGRVFVSGDLDLLARVSASGNDASATYILETRERNSLGDVVSHSLAGAGRSRLARAGLGTTG